MNERDTHFQGFAKLLWQRLQAEMEYGPNHDNLAVQRPVLEQIIAQCAYDLVSHTIMNINPYYLDVLSFDEISSRIPDLTEWPTPPAILQEEGW
jgi:hypothetical protein